MSAAVSSSAQFILECCKFGLQTPGHGVIRVFSEMEEGLVELGHGRVRLPFRCKQFAQCA